MSTDGFDGVLDQCLGVRPGEQVVLLTDEGTDDGVVSRLLEALAARDGIPLVARMPAPHLDTRLAQGVRRSATLLEMPV